MFEGDIKKSGLSEQCETNDSKALRQLRWEELVAQLAATRDLRNELSHSSLEEMASRGRFSSLNAPPNPPPTDNVGNSESAVNLNGLSDGKTALLKHDDTVYEAADKDRRLS